MAPADAATHQASSASSRTRMLTTAGSPDVDQNAPRRKNRKFEDPVIRPGTTATSIKPAEPPAATE